MILFGLLAMGILSGCQEKKTAKELMEDVAAKMEDVVSVSGTMGLDVAMKVSGQADSMDVDMDINMNMDVDMQVTTEPKASHLKGTLTVDITGFNTSLDVENYTMESDGKVVGYTAITSGTSRQPNLRILLRLQTAVFLKVWPTTSWNLFWRKN